MTEGNGHTRALDGLRVVDFGHYLAGPLVGMLLADHGATVIRVTPPRGRRWDHPVTATLRRGKQDLVLDLRSAQDRETARRLAADADVVVENFRPGVMERWRLDDAALRPQAPRLVFCSVPGFPSDSDRAGLRGWETVVAAAAGLCTPAPGSGRPPRPPRVPAVSVLAAFIAWNCILAALLERGRSGRGQRIEVSLFEAAFELFGEEALSPPPDLEPRSLFHAASEGNYACADGRWIHLALIGDRHLRWFVERCMPGDIVEPGMADLGALLADPALARRLRDRITALIATRPAHEWEELVNRAGVPCAVHRDLREWLHSDQARRSGASIGVPGRAGRPATQVGFAVGLSETPPAVARRAGTGATWDAPPPQATTGRAEPGPLAGVTVLDLTQILAGPTAGRILAELGAEVVKVNHPRQWLIAHTQVNSGKATALLDLGRPEARPVLDALVARSDVVMHNFAAGAAQRLGLAEAAVRERRPDVVYGALSAYGAPGPMAGRRGWETLGETVTGMMLSDGRVPPEPERFLVCDYGAGHLFAGAILLGLLVRARSGRGQAVSSSLAQAATYMRILDAAVAEDGAAPEAPRAALHPAADGWLAVAGPPPADVPRDDRGRPSFASRAVADWVERLSTAGLSAHAVVTIDELMHDEEVARRGLSCVRVHPGIGETRFVGVGPRLSRTPARHAHAVGSPGADTRDVVARLGLHDSIDQLVDSGAAAESLSPDAYFDP